MNQNPPDSTTTPRSVVQQQACSAAFIIFYAERSCSGDGGIFTSLEDFIPYRRQGWSGTQEANAAADAMIVAMDEANDQAQPARAHE